MSETAGPARFICNQADPGAPRVSRRVPAGVGPWLLVWLLCCLVRLPLAAQAAAGSDGVIRGQVVDAESRSPLQGASVSLERVGAETGRPLRIQVTDSSGVYEFDRLPAARYRVRVERLGYIANVVEVMLREDQAERFSIGLQVEAIQLPPLRVVGRQAQPYLRSEAPDAALSGARAQVARERQERFLVGDARRLTADEVVEAVTLGEPDLFRALQRIPGVGTRDDYTATLWTRGASWDQTRVYFDGMPLYNPTHAGWLFSAVNPDAVGDVAFHPGHRSARWGEGSAAVLDLRSRSGGQDGPFRGTAEISLASARASLDGEALRGKLSWMVAARRTYVDLLARLFESVNGEDLSVPFDFSDVVARVDGELGEGWGFTASGIVEHDNLRGDVTGLLRGNRGRWGNQAGQITLRAPIPAWSVPLPLLRTRLSAGPWQAELSSGETRFGTALVVVSREEDGYGSATLPDLESWIRHQSLSLRLGPAAGDRDRWSLGYELVRDTVRYDGPVSLIDVITRQEPRDTSASGGEARFTHTGYLRYHALWGERRWGVGPVTLSTGVRVEFGDSAIANAGRVRVAPRLAARWEADAATSLSASWARSFQYTQDVAPAAGPIGPQLHLSAIWVLAGGAGTAYPAARADVATIGAERWIGPEWLTSVNAYRRWTTGLMIANPDSGAITESRTPEEVGENRASGLELQLRRLQGRWTGSVGASLGVSRMRAVAAAAFDTTVYHFPASTDVRLGLDATAMVRLGSAVRVGGAFSYGSGVPFTRLVLADSTRPGVPPRLEAPNAERTPSYASLDLMMDYRTTLGDWRVTVYAQLRNALDRDNAVTYTGSLDCGEPASLTAQGARRVECGGRSGMQDFFEPGIPRLPLIGVRVAF